MTAPNHEHAARARKAGRLLNILAEATASFSDVDVALLRLVGQEVRDDTAAKARVSPPSETTWNLTIDRLQEHRRRTRAITRGLVGNFAVAKARRENMR